MPTFMALVLATTVSLAVSRGLPDSMGYAAKAPLGLLAWCLVYYVTFRILTNIKPD